MEKNNLESIVLRKTQSKMDKQSSAPKLSIPSTPSAASKPQISNEITTTGVVNEAFSVAPLIQEAIKIFTGVLLVLLSIRGLLAFYGAKQESWIEQLTQTITTPFVLPFQGLFADSKAGEVPVFFSLLWVMFLGILLYVSVGLVSRFAQWQRAHTQKPIAGGRKIQSQS